MKYLIASDLHGSSYYVSKLDEIIKRENPDKIILLGDLLAGGVSNEIMDVISILNKYQDKIIAVRGNCDTEQDQQKFIFSIMKDYQVIEVDGLKLYLTHGHINHKVPYQDGILVHGHTHVYELSNTYINPGSVSKPRMYKENTYILYEDRCFKLYDINGKILKEITL